MTYFLLLSIPTLIFCVSLIAIYGPPKFLYRKLIRTAEKFGLLNDKKIVLSILLIFIFYDAFSLIYAHNYFSQLTRLALILFSSNLLFIPGGFALKHYYLKENQNPNGLDFTKSRNIFYYSVLSIILFAIPIFDLRWEGFRISQTTEARGLAITLTVAFILYFSSFIILATCAYRFGANRIKRMIFNLETKIINDDLKIKTLEDEIFSEKNDLNIEKFISQGESTTREWKATSRYNLRSQSADKELYYPIIKSICALANTEGGILLVGYDESSRTFVGINRDGFEDDTDKWENWIRQKLDHHSQEQAIWVKGIEFKYHEVDNIICVIITIEKQKSPVQCAGIGNNSKRTFTYVRAGAYTRTLDSPKDILEHFTDR